MSAITVQVGTEEKEISGLTKKTTSRDVIYALLHDRQVEIKNSSEKGQNFTKDDLEIKNSPNLWDLAKDYVIIESWRGCEKVLPSRTRMFAVWQAWGKEQCYVHFSLKKDKNARFRSSRHSQTREEYRTHSQQKSGEQTNYIQNLSQNDKKRIRRNLMHYQRLMLNQQPQENIDGNNNEGANSKPSVIGDQNADFAGDRIVLSRLKFIENSKTDMVLSEEQFVDGEMTGPECILKHDVRNTFILNAADKSFNKERCTYRRPHHRRRSLLLDDSDGVTDQNVVLSQPLDIELPNHLCSRKSYRYSSSKRRHRRRHNRRSPSRTSKHSAKIKSQSSGRCSVENTASSTSLTLSSGPDGNSHSEGEDADDEKSILADTNSPLTRQKITQYPACSEICCADSGSACTVTITDSSSGNTTCSETSNTSGSSFTTSSSEASSGIDFESYLDKRHNVAVSAVANKSTPAEKPMSGTAKLFKPAQNLLNSFIKKKKTSVPNQLSKPIPAATGLNKTNALKSLVKSNTDFSSQNASCRSNELQNKKPIEYSKQDEIFLLSVEKHEISKGDNDRDQFNEMKLLILSQEENLSKQENKIISVNNEIEQVQSVLKQVGIDPKENQSIEINDTKEFCSRPLEKSQTKWISECSDTKNLESFTTYAEKIVSSQMKIEEEKQNAGMLLQEIKNLEWISSTVSETKESDRFSAVAQRLSSVEENYSSDEEHDSNTKNLSVSVKKPSKIFPAEERSKLANAAELLEIERSRTEMEASLYLGLRLSTELEEVDKLTWRSQQLLQKKFETLLNLTRELAQSDEGISPNLWYEYGDLLAAYDAEVALQKYLSACAENDLVRQRQTVSGLPTSQHTDPSEAQKNMGVISSSDALHHALSPWLWCEHCKNELAMSQDELLANERSHHAPHWLTHSSVPSIFSSLPLPYPAAIHDQTQTTSTKLLPMPPIPDCADSDYEEMGNKSVCLNVNNRGATSTIISTEDVIPKGVVVRFPQTPFQQGSFFNSNLWKNINSSPFQNGSSNADDSGNASAESTASFASTNSDCTDFGSRSGSCDGGSPPPALTAIENENSVRSAQFPECGSQKKSNSKSKFGFTSQLKLGKTEQVKSQNMEIVSNRSDHRAHPYNLRNVESERADQIIKLSRRNSGKIRKGPPLEKISLHRRATSFGKGAVKLPQEATNLASTSKNSALYNDRCKFMPLNDFVEHVKNQKCKTDNASKRAENFHLSFNKIKTLNVSRQDNKKKLTFNLLSDKKLKSNDIPNKYRPGSYDNDSDDTGLSSFCSTESCDRLYPPHMTGESLV